MAMVGIAEVQRPPRHAVKRQHELVRAAVLHPVFVDALRQSADVARVVVIDVGCAQRRHPAHGACGREDRVQCRARRARRVLGIERHQQDPVAAPFAQARKRFGYRWASVAHAELHLGMIGREPEGFEPLAEIAQQERPLALAMHEQRRPVLGPDVRIAVGGSRRPDAQDQAMQQRFPDRAWNLHHSRIRQELGKVAAYRACGRRIRCAEVDEQHSQPRRAFVGKRRFGKEATHATSSGEPLTGLRPCTRRALSPRERESPRAPAAAIRGARPWRPAPSPPSSTG